MNLLNVSDKGINSKGFDSNASELFNCVSNCGINLGDIM